MKEGRVEDAYQGEIKDATKARQTLVVSLNGTRECWRELKSSLSRGLAVQDSVICGCDDISAWAEEW